MEQMNKLHERFDHFTATFLLAGMSNRDEGRIISLLLRRIKANGGTSRNLHLALPSKALRWTEADKGGPRGGEGDPEEVNLFALDRVGGVGVDLSCVLKVWFVFFLFLGRRLRNEILFLFCVRRPPSRADEQKKTG